MIRTQMKHLKPFTSGQIAAMSLAALVLSSAAARGLAAAAPNEATRLEQAFVDAAEKVGPSVVSVAATSYRIIQRYSPWGDESLEEFFRYFFGMPHQEAYPIMSAGSGVIVSADGYILTNEHVVKRAKKVTIGMLDRQEYEAEIVGRDEATDLAVLKIKASKKLPFAPLGDSDAIRVGQWAIAIGNPFQLENTVTVGVISAKGRQLDPRRGGLAARYTSFIQTDASINPGNSGGPLLDLSGKVIGINTMITSPSGGSVGIGFAIPINVAKRVLESIIKEGRVIRPQLGIAYRPLEPEVAEKLGLKPGQGMEVSTVFEGTAAEKAGIKAGDIILTLDGKPLKESDDLRSIIFGHKVGDKVALDVFRKGKRLTLSVPLLEEKRSQEAAEAEDIPAPERPKGDRETWLGMTLEAVTPAIAKQLGLSEAKGVIVLGVDENSPAEKAGVGRGDIIREIEQEPVEDMEGFKNLTRRLQKRKSLLLLIERQVEGGASTMYVVIQREDDSGGK